MISEKDKKTFDLHMGSAIYHLKEAVEELNPRPNENLPFEYNYYREDIQIKIEDLLEEIASDLDALEEDM